jgi:hypothetical protein
LNNSLKFEEIKDKIEEMDKTPSIYTEKDN